MDVMTDHSSLLCRDAYIILLINEETILGRCICSVVDAFTL